MALTQSAGATPKRGRLPRWLLPAFGYSVSIACLIWVYYGFDWKSELPRLAATDWRYVTLAVIFDILVYVCQGWRWNVLLSPLGKTPVWKTIQSVYIGLFANEVLPFRTGEIIRCYLQKRWTGFPLEVVISSALIERLFDGIWLVLGFWLVAGYVNLPGWMVQISRVLVVLLIVCAILLALALSYKKSADRVIARSRWRKVLVHVVEGVHTMGSSHSFWLALLLSLFYLILQVVPVYLLIRGYGLDLSPAAAASVLVILRLGTVIPNAPGNVGTFQALAVAGLSLFGIPRADATGLATLLFLVVTVPLWLAGFIALMLTRMRLDEIHRDARESFDYE